MLPFFYIEDFDSSSETLVLNEINSRHAIQALRMKQGSLLHLTDGLGHLITGSIFTENRKHCTIRVTDVQSTSKSLPEVTIAISMIKNPGRFEWFLEKAAELGVRKVIPLLCKRTETQRLKKDRLRNILISAMLQSQQTWLVEMEEPCSCSAFLSDPLWTSIPNKFIAHCGEGEKSFLSFHSTPSVIMIGPEGDFTSEEMNTALTAGYRPVTLGSSRLRTETAGIAAASLLRIHSNKF